MKNDEETINQSDIQKKPSMRRYIITAVIIALLSVGFFAFWLLLWNPEYNSASDTIIRQVVAKQLNKDPKNLTDMDFIKITELDLSRKKVTSIRFLSKLKNLQKLNLGYYSISEAEAPKWMKILAKLGIYNLSERCVLDLRPLAKLPDFRSLDLKRAEIAKIKNLDKLKTLQELNLDGTKVIDIRMLKKLNKLKILNLIDTKVSDIKAIEALAELETLNLSSSMISDIGPLRRLKKLKMLDLSYTPVSNIKPIEALTELETLYLNASVVSDLEPVKKLTMLKKLYLKAQTPRFIQQVQIDDLRKALPNLDIIISRLRQGPMVDPIFR